MYPLPDDFDLEFLHGHYLLVVSIGPYTTTLEFGREAKETGKNDHVSISLKETISVGCDGDELSGNAEEPMSMTPLVKLLMREITDVVRIGKSSLKINFKPNGYVSLNADACSNYESYEIWKNGEQILLI